MCGFNGYYVHAAIGLHDSKIISFTFSYAYFEMVCLKISL